MHLYSTHEYFILINCFSLANGTNDERVSVYVYVCMIFGVFSSNYGAKCAKLSIRTFSIYPQNDTFPTPVLLINESFYLLVSCAVTRLTIQFDGEIFSEW